MDFFVKFLVYFIFVGFIVGMISLLVFLATTNHMVLFIFLMITFIAFLSTIILG